MRRILLTGKNGQIGWELQRTLATVGEVFAVDRSDMDLTNPDAMRKIVRQSKPTMIVNAAAYTAVDEAESEPDLAMVVNGTAPSHTRASIGSIERAGANGQYRLTHTGGLSK